MSKEKSDEFTEIRRVHRNPTSSQKSYEFTDILGIHNKIPGPGPAWLGPGGPARPGPARLGPKKHKKKRKILEKMSPYKR